MFTRIHYLTTSLFLLSVLSIAQPVGVWDQVPEDKKNIIETICLYPADQRHDVLIAAAHPEILVRMGNIRTNTEFQFKDKMSGISEEDQKRIYNLTRYTDLMNAIGSHRQPRTNEEMKELLKDFPEEIHEDAIFINLHYFNTIVDINQLYRQANQDFQKLLAAYPEDLRKVYMKLSGLPEIVSLLSTNLDVTVIIGDEYRTHPEHLIKELDSLSVVVAEARAQDLNNWKTELESNPEALKEYQASANEFAARDKEYADDVYDGNARETQDQDVNVHVNWTYYYPYWFGWPWWYGYECWYPYPWWYHWGFYYGPQHSMIIWGFPSDFYMYWYFWYDPHLYHYPHYSDHIIGHYYGPRHIGSTIQPVYRQWENQHKRELPEGWFKDDQHRVDRIKEYGKFKVDYANAVRNKTDKSPTQYEYLKKNSNRYPTLKPVLTEKPEPAGRETNPPKDYYPGTTKQPEPYPTRDYEPYKDKPSNPKGQQQHTDQPKPENQQRDPSPSKKESQKPPQRDPAPSQKGKDNTQPPPTQPRKD